MNILAGLSAFLFSLTLNIRRLKLEDYEFEISLGHIVNFSIPWIPK